MALPRIMKIKFARLKARLDARGKQERKAEPEAVDVQRVERKKLVRRRVVRQHRNRI
jgi:hypothetical protein